MRKFDTAKTGKKTKAWLEANFGLTEPSKVAVMLVDTWDNHECVTTTHRIRELSKRINDLLPVFRHMRMQVIFTPYSAVRPEDPRYFKPRSADLRNACKSFPDPPYMGATLCDCKLNGRHCNNGVRPFNISPEIDFSADDKIMVYNLGVFLDDARIKGILFGGAATNQCILTRPFGMKKMINDTMYWSLPSLTFI